MKLTEHDNLPDFSAGNKYFYAFPVTGGIKFGYTSNLLRRFENYRAGNLIIQKWLTLYKKDGKLLSEVFIFNLPYKSTMFNEKGYFNELHSHAGKLLDKLIFDLMIEKNVRVNPNSEIIRINSLSEIDLNYYINIAIKNNWDFDACKKSLEIEKPIYFSRIHQGLCAARRHDIIDNHSFANCDEPLEIISSLPPRYGKTASILLEFSLSDEPVCILPLYHHGPRTSFLNEINRWDNFKNIDCIDTADQKFSIDDMIHRLENNKKNDKKTTIILSLVAEEDSKKIKKILNVLKKHDNIFNKIKITIDEADYGAVTPTSQKKLKNNLISEFNPKIIDYVSGTGLRKIMVSTDNKSPYIDISYFELLLIAAKKHPIFTDKYLNQLDPIKNKHEIKFIKNIPFTHYKDSDDLVYPVVAEINLDIERMFKDLETGIQNSNERIGYENGHSWSKIFKDMGGYGKVISNIFRKFLNCGQYSGDKFSYMRLSNKELYVFLIWVGVDTNENLANLVEFLNNDNVLNKECKFVRIDGESTTNKESEDYAKEEIRIQKEAIANGENPKKLVFLSMDMAQRSFGVSEVQATVFMKDSSDIDSTNQKLSRVLTAGNDIYGNKKEIGFVYNLGLTPDSLFLEKQIVYTEVKKLVDAGCSKQYAFEHVYSILDISNNYDLQIVSKKSPTKEDFEKYEKWDSEENIKIRDKKIENDQIENLRKTLTYDKAKNIWDKLPKSKKEVNNILEKIKKAKAFDKTCINDTDDNNTSSKLVILQDYYKLLIEYSRNFEYHMADAYHSLNNENGICRIDFSEIIKFFETNENARKKLGEALGIDIITISTLINISKYKNGDRIIDITEAYHESLKILTFENSKDYSEESIKNAYDRHFINSEHVSTPLALINDKFIPLLNINTKTTIIDPQCKNGTILREIHVLLLKTGYSKENIQNMLFGREDNLINNFLAKRISGINNISDLTIEDYCDNIQYMKKKFTYTIGNPPYNGPKTNSCNTDTIYPKFVDYNIKIAENVILITPARWFKSDSDQYKNHRNNMIHNYGLKKLEYIENGKYFVGVNVEGGYSISWCQEGYIGDVEFIVNGVSTIKDFKSENIINIDILVGNIENKIKIKNKINNVPSVSLIYNRNGTINSTDSRLKDDNGATMIKCYCSKNRIKYVKFENFKNLNMYKVITPVANSKAYEFKKDFRLIFPNEMATASFSTFLFKTESESKKFINFVSLNLNIFLIKHNKPTQGVVSDCFSLIPQKWDTIQTNEDLYKYYDLTKEEIDYIENNII